MAKELVYLVNIGTPQNLSLSSVKKYLNQFLTDPYVIQLPFLLRQLLVRGLIVPLRAKNSLSSYQTVWTKNGSPLLVYMNDIRKALQKEFCESEKKIEILLRYHESDLNHLKIKHLQKYEKIHFIGLFPQYSQSTNSSLMHHIHKIFKGWSWYPNIEISTLPGSQDELINCWFQHLRILWDSNRFDHLLFSYHGLPLAHLPNKSCQQQSKTVSSCCDQKHYCYAAQCSQWTKELAFRLQISKDQYSLSYQSRLQKSWLKPFTDEWIKELRRKKVEHLAVCCPSFVVDCLETLYEIEYELKEEWLKLGGKSLTLFPSLNTNPIFIAHLRQTIEKKSSQTTRSTSIQTNLEKTYD
jgi:ferrochelatase